MTNDKHMHHSSDVLMWQKQLTRRRVIRGILTAPLAAYLVGCGTTSNAPPEPDPRMEMTPDLKEMSPDLAANTPTCTLTQPDIEGPFYTANAPSRMSLVGPQTPGKRIVVEGSLVDKATCTRLLVGYILDVWHADDAGQYDNAGFSFRGQLKTDAKGAFRLETIMPGRYPDRPYRHIHLKIRAPGGKELLTTQIYFDDDDQLPRQKITGPIAKVNKNVAAVTLVVDV